MAMFKHQRYLFILVLFFIFHSFQLSRAGSNEPGARIDSIYYRIEVQGQKARIFEYEKITVVTENGDDAGVVSVVESSVRKLKSVKITVTKSDGSKPVKAGKKDMIRFYGYGGHSAAYAEDYQYDYHPEVTIRPYTVISETEYEMQTLFLVRGPRWNLNYPISSLVVDVIGKTGDEFRWKTFGNCAEEQPIHAGGSVVRRWVWQRSSDSIIDRDVLMTIPAEERPKIGIQLAAKSFEFGGRTYSGVDSWSEVAEVYRNLSIDKYDNTIPESGASLATSPHALVDSLYRDITVRGRYFFVSIGISGWQTQPASYTEKTLWGDCKGLTTWLVARARKCGVSAYPALVNTREEGAKDPDFPDDEFNHVITLVVCGNDTIWYDPTCDFCAPGTLPLMDHGVLALVVTDSGGKLVRTPESTPEENVVKCIIDVDLTANSMISARASIESYGLIAYQTRAAFRQAERREWNRMATGYLAGDLEKRFVVDSVTIEGLDDIMKPMIVSFTLQSKRPIDRIGSISFFQPYQFTSADRYREYKLEGRQGRVDMQYPYTVLDSVVVHGTLVDEADSIFIPESTTFDTGELTLRSTSSRADGRLSITLEQICRQYAVSTPELLAFANQRKSVLENRLKLWSATK
jgi:hypothetical protein